MTQTELNYGGNTVVEATSKQPWLIPVDGTIIIKVSREERFYTSFCVTMDNDKSAPSPPQVAVRRIAPTVSASSTAQQVSNLLRLAASVESKEELIRISLPLLRLHIGEAMMLYDLLIKVWQ